MADGIHRHENNREGISNPPFLAELQTGEFTFFLEIYVNELRVFLICNPVFFAMKKN